MTEDIHQTKPEVPEFDLSRYPANTLFHERRTGRERRKDAHTDSPVEPARGPSEGCGRRVKKERRRRIDPTTFEKQYTDDELEFMNAMQRFKEVMGKSFPTHGDVIRVAVGLGYRRSFVDLDALSDSDETRTPVDALSASDEF